MSSVSVFDKIGIVAARPVTASSIVGIDGIGNVRATFGLLQAFSIDSKVLAQIKRTLRRVPVIFPMGDDLSEISLTFMAPLKSPCNDVATSDIAAALNAYNIRHVTPERVQAFGVSVGSARYSCLLLGMRTEGSVNGASQAVTVSLRLAGVSVA